jgi:hypothetical protein
MYLVNTIMYHWNPQNDGKLLDKHNLTSENIMLHVFNKIFSWKEATLAKFQVLSRNFRKGLRQIRKNLD